ncbi:hypothetical protein KST88_02685 [Fusobacterium nucleatum]|uniref:hypothetical protein n=1 Tax=Fusobacterium nucleatum TaxID=851 RepID=UPI0030CDD0AF
MSTVGALKFSIDTFLNSKGFKDFKANLKQSMNLSQRFKEVTGSTLGKLAIGYFSITGLVSQYNKAIEASNYQIEQEAKLYNTLRAQNFRDDQIKSIIDMTGELQKLGVVGDEVTLAGAQQLATYRLQENSIKQLLPTMQDLLVKQKGLNGTGQDMEGIASIFAKAMNGQTMVLKRNGIVLSEREEQLLKVGTEEQKVALLAEAVRRSVGEQNKEFLKTPEGKIINAKNRIGDLYETWGMSIRDTRAKFWEFIAENADGIQDLVTKVFKAGGSFVDTFIGVFRDIKRGFNALPDGAKTGLKVIGGLALATKFPLVALGLVIEDVFAAFQGKESFTEDAINALLKFTGTDYRFADLRKDINEFFKEITSQADMANEEIGKVNFALQETIEFLKTGIGLAKMVVSLPQVVGAGGKYVYDRIFHDKETAEENWDNNFFVNTFSDGWDTLNTSSNRMFRELPDRLHKTELRKAEERAKNELEAMKYIIKNQNTFGVPVEKDFVIPYQPVNSGIVPDFNKILEPKTFDNKVMNGTKKAVTANQTVNYNPTYKTDVTINESKDGKNGFEDIVKALIERDKENLERIKAQAGMGFLF